MRHKRQIPKQELNRSIQASSKPKKSDFYLLRILYWMFKETLKPKQPLGNVY